MFFPGLEEALLDFCWSHIDEIELCALGAPAVGVLGDGRMYGLSVTLKLRPEVVDFVRIAEIATGLVNKTPGVARVLIEIARA